jgi:sulfoxide reductase heme-binding subunit YedZ
MSTDPSRYLFWITSRAAGTVALVLASVAVSLGLVMGTRLLRRFSTSDLRVAHEVLALATLAAIAVHGLALLGDSTLSPSLLDIALPFQLGYRTFWTGLGVIAGYGLALLGLGYYARRRIGPARWRRLHRFTALAWLLGLAHALGSGSDSGQTWFLAMLAIVAVPALTLLAWRMSGGRPRAPRRAPAIAGAAG